MKTWPAGDGRTRLPATCSVSSVGEVSTEGTQGVVSAIEVNSLSCDSNRVKLQLPKPNLMLTPKANWLIQIYLKFLKQHEVGNTSFECCLDLPCGHT